MTPEQIQIAMAEVDGLKAYHHKDGDLWSLVRTDGRYLGHRAGLSEEHIWRVACPDYPNDLNAVHEVEKKLTEEQECFYYNELCKITGDVDGTIYHYYASCATALQRCEAILRTLGKWKESGRVLPQMRCQKCGSLNMEDSGSWLVAIYQCKDCGERHCEDSGDVGCA